MVSVTYGIRPYGNSPTGWGSPRVLVLVACSIASLIAFFGVESRAAEPMFRLALFRIRAFSFGTLSTFLSAVARGGLMFMLIIWLQGIWLPLHGYDFTETPLWAGIYMLPLTIGMLIAGPTSGYLSDRFGARPFATGGMLVPPSRTRTKFASKASALTGEDAKVFFDPFGDMSAMVEQRGWNWDYPPISAEGVDLLLVTHEHRDHNAVDAIPGDPAILRSTAGTHDSPVGEVVGVASEHDAVAGTQRGPNTIFAFELDGVPVAHFGDFGQSGLRPEQADALQGIDLLFIPVGGGPTIGASAAASIVSELAPRWVVPMHYRTPKIGFLETADEFLDQTEHVERLDEAGFDTAAMPVDDKPVVVVPAAP